MDTNTRTSRVTLVGVVLSVQVALAGACLVHLASGWGGAVGDHVGFGSVLFAAMAAWGFLSWKLLVGELVDAYPAFLLSFILFSGGQLLLHAIGALPEGPLSELFIGATVERTVLIVNASLSLLHLGALLRAATASTTCPARPRDVNVRTLRRIGVCFVALGLPATLLDTGAAVQAVMTAGYGAIYGQSMRTGLANLAGFLSIFLIPGVLIMLGTGATLRWNVRFAWAVVAFKSASLLFIGQRGYAVMALVPMLLLHDRVVRRVRWSLAATVASAALLVAFPLIRTVRSLDARERAVVLSSGVQLEDPFTNTISEMGGSMRTLAHTIELVPASRPYDFGLGLLRAASTVMPNLFWDRHPGALSYGEWLTRTVDPWLADVGGSLGFSLVAEGYINFGRFGGPMFCGAVGFLLAGALTIRRNRQTPESIFAAIVLSVILFLPRSEASVSIRTLAWCAAVPHLLTIRRARSSVRPAAWFGLPIHKASSHKQ